jgi:hypothetical protein
MESGSSKPPFPWRWTLPEAKKYSFSLPDPPVLMLLPLSSRPPLPLDRLGGPDVLGVFAGSMAEFRHAVRYRDLDSACGPGLGVVPLMPECPEGVQLVGRLLAFSWSGCVLVGSGTAIDRWLALPEREPV